MTRRNRQFGEVTAATGGAAGRAGGRVYDYGRQPDLPDMAEVETRLAHARQVMAKPLAEDVKAKLRAHRGRLVCGPVVK